MGEKLEAARLAALKAYRVLDTPAEAAFDEITARAAALFDAPISLVSLIDDQRQWFKSSVGLQACSTPRGVAFCDHAVRLEPHGVLVVEDVSKDPRFAENPLSTGAPFVRFYVGAVLTSPDGFNLGTLCVIDDQPRPSPPSEKIEQLKLLAELVVARLETRRVRQSALEQQRLLQMTETLSGAGHWRADFQAGTVDWSSEVYRMYGRDPASFEPTPDNWLDLIHPDDREELRKTLRQIMSGETLSYHARIIRADGAIRKCEGRVTCELDAAGKPRGVFGVFEDVTERETARATLERSRARYKLLAASMADTVARIQLDGASDYISPAVEALLGWRPEDMAGQSALQFVHPDDAWLVAAALKRLADGQDVATVRHRARHRAGHAVWVETRFRAVQDQTAPYAVAVIRDISDRKALEDQLHASEARSRKIVANAYQAIVTMDAHGRVTGWNRFAEQTFGWTSGEAFGKLLAELIVPVEHREAHAQGLARFLATGQGKVIDQRIEVPALRKSGEVFPVELAISADLGPEGWSFTALMHDISARKAQFALFETAFHSAAVGVALVLPEGRFSRVNQAFCQIVGYDVDELLAADFQSITHPDDLEKDLELLAQLVAGDIPNYHMDKRYFRKDGAIVWVRLSVSMVAKPDGSPKHFIAQVQDLTERVRSEEALARQAEHLASMTVQLEAARDEAEAAARAKGEFLANISHELRTPLNGIVGFSRLLAEERLAPSARRKADRIRAAGETLNSLINDVLDFSKLEAGGVLLDCAPFDFDAFLADTLAFVEPQASERAIVFARTGPQVGWVVGDNLRLRQVLLNLLSNAVKFSREGEVGVRTQASFVGGDVNLRVEVRDRGVGISPEAQARLFSRFVQADGSITRTFGGTGLGLAICKQLIEVMGGRLGVESSVGEGSTFWFEVVLKAGTAIVGPGAGGVRRATFQGHVLLVDDVELNRELAGELLRRRGLTVDLASDGAEAVQAVARRRYDLVLMDLHMPVRDGLAAAAEIFELGLPCGPIVALTASDGPAQLAACREAGMVGHVLKPIDERELDRVLSEHIPARGVRQNPAPVDGLDVRGAFVEAMGPAAAIKMGGLFLAQMEDKFLADDLQTLQMDAHSVAGSAGLLGLDGLGATARAVEAACAAGLPDETLIQDIRDAAANARTIIGEWIASLER